MGIVYSIEEIKKFQRIAIVGVDLNSKHEVAYTIWIWDKSNNLIKPMKTRFLKGIKTHRFQELEKQRLVEKVSKELINIALNSIKEYNCEIAIISFENLNSYEAGNNNKKINKKNTEWLRRIQKRTHEKAL